MAKPNYAFQKRQKELAKKQKKEAKEQKKAAERSATDSSQPADGAQGSGEAGDTKPSE